MSKNLYIVPYDFTPVTEKALEYALFLAKRVDAEIRLLHLAPDKAKGMPKVKLLEDVKNKLNVPAGVQVSSSVKIGDVFTDLARIAKEEKAQLIIMGTHGIRGFQRVSGSHAMKVVTSADCPFLIVQKNTILAEITDVAVPIDLTKESLQIVNIAGDIANIFKAKVNVLAEKQSDQILNTRLQNRIGIVSKQYEERDIEAKMNILKSGGGYGKKIMHFVKNNNVGLIAISYHSESLLPQFDSFAQNIITNKPALPVLIINSKLASALYF
ncbi:MAG: universal stress protein [Crocinitomicaceae bacterium]|nr:universal stress protein [Crocinitomicaceae bacterium]